MPCSSSRSPHAAARTPLVSGVLQLFLLLTMLLHSVLPVAAHEQSPAATRLSIPPTPPTQVNSYPDTGLRITVTNQPQSPTCRVLQVPPSVQRQPYYQILTTMDQLNYDVVWSNYRWINPDGASMKIYRTQANEYIISIAGSVPVFFDDAIEDGYENAFSQTGNGSILDAAIGAPTNAYLQTAQQNGRFASDYIQFIYLSIQNAVNTGLIPANADVFFAGHSQGGNVAQLLALAGLYGQHPIFQYPGHGWKMGPPNLSMWNDVQVALADNPLAGLFRAYNISVRGGISVGSRPHGVIDRLNRAFRVGTWSASDAIGTLPDLAQDTAWSPSLTDFWIFENESKDPIPKMFSPETLIGLGGTIETDLLLNMFRFSNAAAIAGVQFGSPQDFDQLTVGNLAVLARTQLWFLDPNRFSAMGDQSAHGESYIDPTLIDNRDTLIYFPNTYGLNLSHDVDRMTAPPPNHASLLEFAPAQLSLANNTTLSVLKVMGYSYDCYSAVVYQNRADFMRDCRTNAAWQRQSGNGIGAPAPFLLPLGPRLPEYDRLHNQPDGIPDALWVGYDDVSIGKVMYDFVAGPSDGTPTGAPQAGLSLLLNSNVAWLQQGLPGDTWPSAPSFDRVTYNTKFSKVMNERRRADPQQDCNPSPRPNPRYPGGTPDDYEAPWTSPETVADTWLTQLVSDRTLTVGSSAWLGQVQIALEARVRAAQAKNLTTAQLWYQYVAARLAVVDHLETFQREVASSPDFSLYISATLALGQQGDL